MTYMYPWCSDGSSKKLDRAIAELKRNNLPATEEAVKELYIKYGGLVLDLPTPEAETEIPKSKTKK